MGEEHYVSTSHTYSCDSLARRLHTVPYLRPSATRPIYGATPCYPHDMCATAAHRQIAAARRLRLQALSPGCGGDGPAISQPRARLPRPSRPSARRLAQHRYRARHRQSRAHALSRQIALAPAASGSDAVLRWCSIRPHPLAACVRRVVRTSVCFAFPTKFHPPKF